MRYKTLMPLAGIVASVCTSMASAATFYQRAVVDLTPITNGANANDVGTNVSAVAWDGSTAYLAGFNGGGTARDTALVNVADVLTTPTFGSRYGVQAATASGGRGYLGMDYKAGVGVATVFDSGSTAQLAEYTTAGTAIFAPFNLAARPPAGPSYDTQSSRLSYIYQGTNLVRNVDVSTGASTGTPNTNFGNIAGLGTAYRDFDYASNGDLYARVNNNLVRANRADATSYSATPTLLVDLTDANNIGETVQVVEGFGANALFALFNDKASNAVGQNFASVVRAVDATGANVTLSFLNTDGTAASPLATSTGTAYYDFSYHAATQTLAVLDYTNRQLYVFGVDAVVVPEPATLAALAGIGGLVIRRRRRA